MESEEYRVSSTLKKIAASSPEDSVLESFELLFKLITNIITNPSESKFRTIKTSNQTLRAKLFSVKYIDELLQAIGFSLVDGNYVFSASNLAPLGIAVPLIMETQTAIRDTRLTPEEKAKKAHFDEYKRKMEKDREQQEKMLKQIELDKKENQDRQLPSKDSVANKPNYGAKSATWKDIGVDLCAQKGG